MENVFNTLAEITRPETPARYIVKTETRGTLFFDELPNKTYFAMGYQDESDKGKAYLFAFDKGTCLIPIIDTRTGLQVCKPEFAGHEINEGDLKSIRMVTQHTINTLNLEFIEDYFDLIIDEKAKDNKEKAKDLFCQLSEKQKEDFFNYVDTAYYYDEHDNNVVGMSAELVNYLTL